MFSVFFHHLNLPSSTQSDAAEDYDIAILLNIDLSVIIHVM